MISSAILRQVPNSGDVSAMRLIMLTGASGSGKTAIARAFQALYADRAKVLFFDSIGVPSPERVIADFGSGEAWQRAMAIRWMAKIAARAHLHRCVLLEGQVRPAFLAEAAAAAGLSDHRIILVDCDDATRTRRLVVDRAQPDLANSDMLNWARFLRIEAERAGCEKLDTSSATIEACVGQIARHLPAA
jgi:dephospho-CoA kinase